MLIWYFYMFCIFIKSAVVTVRLASHIFFFTERRLKMKMRDHQTCHFYVFRSFSFSLWNQHPWIICWRFIQIYKCQPSYRKMTWAPHETEFIASPLHVTENSRWWWWCMCEAKSDRVLLICVYMDMLMCAPYVIWLRLLYEYGIQQENWQQKKKNVCDWARREKSEWT